MADTSIRNERATGLNMKIEAFSRGWRKEKKREFGQLSAEDQLSFKALSDASKAIAKEERITYRKEVKAFAAESEAQHQLENAPTYLTLEDLASPAASADADGSSAIVLHRTVAPGGCQLCSGCGSDFVEAQQWHPPHYPPIGLQATLGRSELPDGAVLALKVGQTREEEDSAILPVSAAVHREMLRRIGWATTSNSK